MNTEVNKNVRAYAKADIHVNGSIENVYQTLADISQWPVWQSEVTKAEMTGAPEVGHTFHWKANGMNVTSRFHTVEKNSKLGWTGKMLWVKATHNWWFQEEESGTRVVVEEALTGFGAGLLKKTLENGMNQSLEELKQQVERM